MEEKRKTTRQEMGFGGMIIRILVSMIVLAVAAFFTPYFSITGFVPLLFAAIAIGVIDYLIERFVGFDASPFGRGITGFIVSALIIYLTGVLVQGVFVNWLGAILAALVIGIINMIIPGRHVM
ncbi:4 TMS phage holin, superfamily IV [Geosporobacter subterraneus DSM 17957]|uniref:4 TMS phage holin, superfamily IV n=1 Tax=Geosporobacter subterraneus DSM 17957 TaxID=1121919 RepID=A0A1M6QB88_9FIRM|nr:phage holin family protein [Geosporobacter subterraneus]SHK17426.1 4 TMS phage holin, superfamily IV [Geosporobacter subterraneus DSM 17957]